jgi:hypothetical protein
MIKKSKHKSKQPRWLAEQKNKKRQSLFKFIRPILTAVLLLVVIFCVFQVYLGLRGSKWDGVHNFNFTVLVGDQIYVISYQPSFNTVNILQILPKTYLPLSNGFGEYPASSIWSLGNLEKIGGGNLLWRSTQYFLGIPIQGWGKIAKFKNEDLRFKSKNELMELIIRMGFAKERNLTLWDLGRLLYKVNGLPLSAIDFYSLGQTRAGEEVTLPDGSQVFRVQKEFLEKLSADLFGDNDFSQEGIIWGVVNQTNFSGLASWVATLINNIGGEVAFFEEKSQQAQEGIWCGNEKNCSSYSVKLLAQTLKLKKIIGKNLETRAEVVVVLGDNYQRFFYQR